MISKRFLKVAVVLVASIATNATGLAQSQLIDDSEENGRLARARQRDAWSFVLDKKTKTLDIIVSCDTTKVLVILKKVGEDRPYILIPTKGWRTASFAVTGNDVSAHPDHNRHPALDKGRYIVTVEALNGQGTGDYTIRIPQLRGAGRQPEGPIAAESKADLLTRLRKDLDAVRTREAELVEQIRNIEWELKK